MVLSPYCQERAIDARLARSTQNESAIAEERERVIMDFLMHDISEEEREKLLAILSESIL